MVKSESEISAGKQNKASKKAGKRLLDEQTGKPRIAKVPLYKKPKTK